MLSTPTRPHGLVSSDGTMVHDRKGGGGRRCFLPESMARIDTVPVSKEVDLALLVAG